MLKIKLLLEKQENLIREKLELKRIKEENERTENKKNMLLLHNELKITQNTEVPNDDQINDLTKYNFQKNSTNLQKMGGHSNDNRENDDDDCNIIKNKISCENSDELNEMNEVFDNLIGNKLSINI